MKNDERIVNVLKYDKDNDNAPKLVAQGKGYVAERIKEIARENEIPIYKDEKLSRQLFNLSIGEEIPPELYQIVAEILSFIATIDKNEEVIF